MWQETLDSHQEGRQDDEEEEEEEEEAGKRSRGGPRLLQVMERERGLGIFVSHLKEAGLSIALGGSDEENSPTRSYTVFAPSDRAWAKASMLPCSRP